MNPPLSSRLRACCDFVRPGDRVADIGADHGYLGIRLLQSGIASSVIASDVHEMPLQSALHNAHKYGVADQVSFYLSDGAQNIPRDFDVMVCAGMGADTIEGILESSPWLRSRDYRLILQCQSRRPALRAYLSRTGWRISRETLAQDGKFLYPVIEAVYEPAEQLTPGGCYISPALLASGSPLLPAFYDRVISGLRTTVEGLSRSGSDKLVTYHAILQELLELEAMIHGNR